MTVGDFGQCATPGQASPLGSPDDRVYAWEALIAYYRTLDPTGTSCPVGEKFGLLFCEYPVI